MCYLEVIRWDLAERTFTLAIISIDVTLGYSTHDHSSRKWMNSQENTNNWVPPPPASMFVESPAAQTRIASVNEQTRVRGDARVVLLILCPRSSVPFFLYLRLIVWQDGAELPVPREGVQIPLRISHGGEWGVLFFISECEMVVGDSGVELGRERERGREGGEDLTGSLLSCLSLSTHMSFPVL